MSGAWSFAFWSISNIAHLLHHARPEHFKTPLYASNSHKYTYTSPICLQCPPPGISGQFRTTTDTIRHQTTPTDGPRHSKWLFKDAWRLLLTLNGICWSLLESFGVWRRLLVSYGVWRCEEGVWRVSERVSECLLWTCLRFGFLRGSIWVFRPCMVQQMLHIGNASKGKTPRTWHLWNIKIPKPSYISSLKITGLLHFSKFLGLSDEIYNPQSLWITL